MNFYNQSVDMLVLTQYSNRKYADKRASANVKFASTDAGGLIKSELYIPNRPFSELSVPSVMCRIGDNILSYLNGDAFVGIPMPEAVPDKYKITQEEIERFESYMPTVRQKEELSAFMEKFLTRPIQDRPKTPGQLSPEFTCKAKIGRDISQGAGYVREFAQASDLFAFECCELFVAGVVVKHCKACGRLFVPRVRADEEYCSYKKKKGKTCKEKGYESSLTGIEKEIRSRYKTLNAWKNRNFCYSWAEETFEFWKKRVAQLQKGVKSGRYTDDDIRSFLAKSLIEINEELKK